MTSDKSVLGCWLLIGFIYCGGSNSHGKIEADSRPELTRFRSSGPGIVREQKPSVPVDSDIEKKVIVGKPTGTTVTDEKGLPGPLHLVEGYLGSRYVYGEVEFIDDTTIEGYIYLGKTRKIYIYGERYSEERFNAFDQSGRRFDLHVID